MIKRKLLTLLKPGTVVSVNAPKPFEAIISAINILSEECFVLYDVYWWEGKEKKDLTLREDEITCKKPKHINIGFDV